MIVDSIDNAGIYEPLGPRIAVGLAYLAAFDPETENGRYEIDGDRVFALVQGYQTAPAEEKRFEAHRLHIDIQYLVSGEERVYVAPTAVLDAKEDYNATKDVTFYHDPASPGSIHLRAGDFAIFYPHDAHKPNCVAGGPAAVKKVVVKVRV